MVKNLPAMQETWFNPTPVFLHGEFHGQMILAGYSPWGHRVGTPLSTNIYSTRLQTLGKILKKKKQKKTKTFLSHVLALIMCVCGWVGDSSLRL